MRSTTFRRAAIVFLVVATMVGGAVLATASETAEPKASSGNTDMVAHGTAWVPERPGKFKTPGFKHYGWGTYTRRVKGAGNEWVHASLPYLSRLEGDRTFVTWVEFCAQSTNGANTKPTHIHVWNNGTRIEAHSISWAANNNYQCHGVTVDPPIMAESLGISVRIHYDNDTDSVTLFKAWARASS